MNKLLLASTIAVSTAASCAPLAERAPDIIERAQQHAVQACAFLPTAETVAALLENEQFDSALDVATVVCNTVTQPRAQDEVPSVGGVVIEGEFVDAG